MKKLLGLLLVVSALVVADASAWGNCCGNKVKSCAKACPSETTEAPKPVCEVLVTKQVCPERHVDITYTCPEGSSYADGSIAGKRGRN